MTQLSLETVTIDGFRGLRNLTLEGLGPVNILVGENNSGKASVLEALSILCNPCEPGEWLAMVRRRDFGGLDETRIQSLRWCFRQTGTLSDPEFMFNGSCSLGCLGKFPLRQLEVEYKDMVGQPSQREVERLSRKRYFGSESVDIEEEWSGAEITHRVFWDQAGRTKSILEALGEPREADEIEVMQVWEEDRMMGRFLRPRKRERLPTETLTPYSYQLNRLQVRSQSQHLFNTELDWTHGRGYVLDLMSLFDSDVVGIEMASLRGNRPAIYIQHKKLGFAPLTVFGDALRRAVLLASTMYLLKGGGVLLIDEVESGIHFRALQRVMHWLTDVANQLQVQVIATTHSLEAVDAICSSLAERSQDLVTYHLEETEENTVAKRISGDLLLRLRRERGLDVR
jgi:energy-coupling factor transporter ATP-binding protein EcfA2